MTHTHLNELERATPGVWGQEIVELRHNLHESPLFSDDALAALIERVPQQVSPVNTMAAKVHETTSWTYCDRSGLSGMEVLSAIKTGRLWINLQKLEESDPSFKILLDTLYDELRAAIPGFNPYRTSIGVLISSPDAQVFYHADVPVQSLMQVRGQKRIHIYPSREPYLKTPELENIIRGITEEDITYDPAFDIDADSFELTAGDFLHWPLNAPHRVENLGSLNVSVTLEHWTYETRRHFAMNYGNGILRRELGITPRTRRIAGPAFWSKVALTAAWRLAGLQKKQSFRRFAKCRVDPSARNGVVPLQTSVDLS